ncbi:ral guanine nucleotide dissociation stimulator-like [Leopardus geoffroyi]|uniref:ral guanine nucleotide dissociation stimulator-like n=1 Tax=Leopardus geoffroyi TaxID=46844 RepID=UPI001E265358|nr:ral guanine nucleotide dissociation stimulator-like [Leopardus geoffroyi]
MAISSILGTWLDHYPEDFFQPPDFISLQMLRAYIGVHMPGSELQRRDRLLYSSRRNHEPNEPESLAMAPAPEQDPDVPQELAPAISVVPTAASQPRLPAATTHPGAQQLEELVTLPAESPRVQVVVPALIHCQELEETPAPLVDPTQTLSSLQPQLAGSRKGWSNHLLQLSNQPRLPRSGACWLQPQRMP